jgi:hypothetical protein
MRYWMLGYQEAETFPSNYCFDSLFLQPQPRTTPFAKLARIPVDFRFRSALCTTLSSGVERIERHRGPVSRLVTALGFACLRCNF